MRKFAWIVWVGAVGIAGGSMLSQPSRAAEERKVDFVKDIQPIFETTCVKCHGADPQGKKPKGKFDMTTKQKAFSTGENKDKNFKKKAEDSIIYQTLLGPVGSGDDETTDHVRMVERKIDCDRGAKRHTAHNRSLNVQEIEQCPQVLVV